MNKRIPYVTLMVVAVTSMSGCKLPSTIPESPLKQAIGSRDRSVTFKESELSPKQAAEVCIVTAQQLETAGHLNEAIGLYEKARQHNSKAIDYSRRLAVLYDKQGNVANATREYAQAIESDPKNADLLNDFGQFHLNQGDLLGAESKFRSAIALDEQHQRAWTNLGIALAQQARYQVAFDAFTPIVGPAAAHSNIGTIMAKQGHTADAQQAFQQALALNPNLKQPRAFLSYYAQHSSLPSATPASFTSAEARRN